MPDRTECISSVASKSLKLLAVLLALASPWVGAQPWVGDNAFCYAFADGGDQLVSLRKDGTNPQTIGGGAGVTSIEAIAFDPKALNNPNNGNATVCGVLYAANANQFGWLRLDNSCYPNGAPGNAGQFIPIGTGFGSCTHPDFSVAQAVTDVDGLQFDINTGTLWATERNGGIDFILQVNKTTGTVVPNSFPTVGPNISCVSSAVIPPRDDLDDIAIDPSNGDMYVVNNEGGTADLLLQIDPTDGSLIRIVGPFGPGNGVFDMEGLSFGVLGDKLYGATGGAGNPANSMWEVAPKKTGKATTLGPFTIGSDHEGIACSTDNVITGTVFLDVDQDGAYEPGNGDGGHVGVTVNLYRDFNGNGIKDSGDTLVTSTTTDAAGFYSFGVATANAFVVDIDTSTLPAGAFLTTDNIEGADFRTPNFPFLFGNIEPDNNFGFFGLGDLDIVKTSSPQTPLSAGDTINYTIVVTNNTGNRHTGISVSDVLPVGVTYTPNTTVATGPRPLRVRDEFDDNSFAIQDGPNNWATNWIEDASETANFPGSLQPGNVYISAGLLHLKDNPDTGTQPSLAREVDLSAGFGSARLTFDWQTDSAVDSDDAVVVEMSSGGINGVYTVLETFDGIAGVDGGSRSYDISAYISGSTAVRFRVSNNYGGTDEFFFVNNVEITASSAGTTVLDEFGAISFANQDGPDNWAGLWSENDTAGAGPGAGNVFISGGLLNLRDEPDTGTEPSLARAVNLAGETSARLIFDFQTTAGVDTDDAVVVEVSSSGTGGAYTSLETITGLAGVTSDSRSYDITSFISANTAVRFRVSNLYGGTDEFFQVDNVSITAGESVVTLDNGGISSPQLVDGAAPSLVEPTDGFVLEDGQTLTVTFDATVNTPAPPGVTLLTNLASVDSAEGLPSTDTAVNTVPLPAGTLTLDKTSSGAGTDVVQGQPITYTLRPRANGPSLLNNIFVSDPVPPGTTFVSADPGHSSGPNPVVWNLGSNLAGVPGSSMGSSGSASLVSVADTHINQDKPDENKGTDAELKLKNSKNTETKDKRGLIRWNLSSIPAGAVVTSATMRFYINGADPGVNINIHRLTRSWAEGVNNNKLDADWIHWDEGAATPPADEWAMPGGDFNGAAEASFQASPENAYKDVVVPNALIQGWLDSPSGNFGVLLDAQGSDKEVKIRSREEGNSREPILQVNYLQASTTTSLATDKMLVSDGDAFTVTMTLTSTAADPTVTPGTLNIASNSGAGATCGAAVPASQPITTGGPISFVWSCTGDAAAVSDRLIFTANAGGTQFNFGSGSSNSLLISPPLTFQVTVDNPLDPNINRILNIGTADSDETLSVDDLTSDPVVKGVIGDRVWLDVDGDGVQDVGEPGLANVRLELRDGVCGTVDTCLPAPACPTALTDASGNYFFPDLAPGDYTVFVDPGTVPGGLTRSNGACPLGPVTVATDETYFALDFGYTNDGATTAIIGDRVWSDANDNGLQDAGEVGLAGVTVNLVGAGADGIFGTGDDTVAATATTGPDGTYLFTGVAPGEYLVDVGAGVPAGYNLSSGAHSNPDPTNPISVIGGDIVTDADFGYFNMNTFTIADRLWLDGDADGSQDAGEPGIAGVTLSLLNDMGEVIATTVTDANGDFSFDGVPNGNYTIAINDAMGMLGGLGGTTANAMNNQRPVTVAGADVSGINFGYNVPGAIGDTIFSDSAGTGPNGIQDPGELGIAGVTVQLWRDANGDGIFDNAVDTLVDTTLTAADGTYLFAGLLPGTYFSSVDDSQSALTGYAPTTTDQETGANAAGTQIEAALVGLNDSFLAADFGYRNSALPEVSGTVFLDVDADGVQEPDGVDGAPMTPDDETGFTGVTVNLVSDPDGIPDSGDEVIVATTISDANGDYTFFDVPPGDYQVVVGDVNNVLDGYTLTSGLDERPITVAAADISDVDFGYVRMSGNGSIGDTVWLDVDPPGAAGPDGVRGPSEAGLSMVTVSLYQDRNGNGIAEPGGADGAPIATTVTDANGNYVFNNLPPGSYFVDVDGTTLPAGLTPTVGTTDPSAVIGLSDGEDFEDADFGYRPDAGTATLGDSVWYDANGNGLQEPGEVGIAGVVVTLVGLGPDGINGTADDVTFMTTTGPDGSYLFTGVPPDTYFAFFDPGTLPAGTNPTPTNTGTDSSYNVLVAAGDVITTLDWGFNGGAVGSIGDFVWLDVDGDGVQDAGEAGIPGVTIDLVDPVSGTILATTTTDKDGNYLFSGLPRDVGYQVRVTDIDTVLIGLNASTGAPGTLTPTAGTPNITTADFGYAPSGGSGSIGSNVWRDLDADGIRDAGEPPIQGVTINVWRDLNGNGIIEPGLDNLVRTVTTDFNGEYELKGLPLGEYIVDVTDTAGVLAGMSKTTGPSPGADDNSQADPYPVVLTVGDSNNLTADFGYRDDAVDLPASITGTVFLDDNINGVFEDPLEPVVNNVEVLLYRILANGNRALIGRTFTDVNGDYSFDGLPPGNYEIRVATDGTAAAGYQQTTQGGSNGVQRVIGLAAGTTSTDNNFGFVDVGVTTTPVTLAYFAATEDNDGISFEWQTATEVGHVGFNLLGFTGGSWQPINDAIIASSGTDSISRRAYEYRATNVQATQFMLEDLDIMGVSRRHGPFELEQPQGRKSAATSLIDWDWIKAEHADKASQRKIARRKGGASGVDIAVNADGVYRVSFADLGAIGFTVSATDLALLNRGSPVPLHVDVQGQFVEFVGQALDTLYTRTNVYQLVNDRTLALSAWVDAQVPNPNAAAAQGYVENRRFERDRLYSFASPTGDPWFDTEILAFTSPVSRAFDLDMEDRLPGPVNLTVGLWGVTNLPENPDHHIRIDVNGTNLADETFDGLVDYPISFAVPESALTASGNVIDVVSPGDTGAPFDLTNVDYYEVTYPRAFVARDGELVFTAAAEAFEVSALPQSEVRVYRQSAAGLALLTNVEVSGQPGDYSARFAGGQEATYYVVSGPGIRQPQLQASRDLPSDLTRGKARLLIISHADFIAGLDRLVTARRAQGWTVKVVDVADVYAAYSHGIFDPEAIRSYINVAATALGSEAILLVGGDTYDYQNYLGLGSVSFMPSLYGQTGDLIRYAPADGLYTDRDGDQVPDLAIGRFPVRTGAELDVIIDRTLQFESLAGRKSILLAADDYDQPSRFDFAQASEQLASLVPQNWRMERAYIDELGVSAARDALISQINAGVALTSYEGHSSPTDWSFDGLFSATDASGLSNSGQPTVVTQWGCWTTYYVSPKEDTMAHKLLLSGDRGAAAVLGATTLTEARSERALGIAIYARLFEPGATIGQVVLDAKRELAQFNNPAVLDVLIGWNLLGDPTLSGFGSVTSIPVEDGLFTNGFE